MLRFIWILMGACVLASGCNDVAGTESERTRPPVPIQSSEVDPETGNLIALWMIRSEETPKGELEPVLVPHPYAIYIHWPNPHGYPDPVDRRIFLVYDNVAKKTYRTGEYEAFLEIVSALPENITLLQLDTCTISRCHMPEKQWARLEQSLADGNRKWATDPCSGNRISRFCYCEFLGGFVYPGDRH